SGVIATTIWRAFAGTPPEAGLMGLFGLIALAVDVAAILPLPRFRKGDANMRAVWLFSRNDAIGNAAVVVAAGLVWWLGSAWPDLIVAFAIAGLFLHSSWSIIRDARSDLREGRGGAFRQVHASGTHCPVADGSHRVTRPRSTHTGRSRPHVS
ncbi:MAG: cation transporter, partial [Litorimonas sp.]